MTIKTMTIAELAECCMREMNNYRRGLLHDDCYCLEIFNRAIFQRDQYAWEILQNRLTPTVLQWMHRHHKHDIACRFDSEENYVAQAFERFWQSTVHGQRPEFNTMAAALRYLYASLNGAILDTLRAYSRAREMPLPEPGHPGEPVTEEGNDGGELLEVLKQLIPQPRELRLAYLLFHCGLKPRDIVQRCSQEFPYVQEIYRLRRNIIERLQRNVEYIRWQLEPVGA